MGKIIENLGKKPFRRKGAHLPDNMNNGKQIAGSVRISGIYGDCVYHYLNGNIDTLLNTNEVILQKFKEDGTCVVYDRKANKLTSFGDETNDWIPYVPLLAMAEKAIPGTLMGVRFVGEVIDLSTTKDVENIAELFDWMYQKGVGDNPEFPTKMTVEEIGKFDLDEFADAIKAEQKKMAPPTPTPAKSKAKAKPEVSKDEHVIKMDRELSEEEKMRVPVLDFSVISIPDYVKFTAEYMKRRLDRNRNANVLYFGPAGTGKSYSAKILASITGLPHYRQVFSRGTDEVSIVAGADVTDGTVTYNDSPLVQCVRDGGIIELQEFYNAKGGVLTSLNELLEEGFLRLANGKVIKRSPYCFVVATANIEYAGGQAIDFSTDSRFKIKVRVDEVSDKELIHRLSLESGNKDTVFLTKIVKAYRDIKKVLQDEEHDDGIADIRALEAWAEAVDMGMSPKEAAYVTFLPGISKEKKKMDEIMDSYIRQLF